MQPRPEEFLHYGDINSWWRGEGVCRYCTVLYCTVLYWVCRDAGWRLTEEIAREQAEPGPAPSLEVRYVLPFSKIQELSTLTANPS